MQSVLDPSVLYTDLSRDVVEHDVDVVSDLWSMDGRDVYRGSRDTQYVHANVYWLYTEELERTGLVEHSLTDHADFRILWFHDNPFATLLQEEWTTDDSLWSILPQTAVERFLAEDWTTPSKILAACLHGDTRIVNVNAVLNIPTIYSCTECGLKTLKKGNCGNTTAPLDFPDKSKIVFIDDDLYVCQPPSDSRVWELLGFRSPKAEQPDDEPALQEPVPESQPAVHLQTPDSPPDPAPHPPHPTPSESQPPQTASHHPESPPAQTSEPPSHAAEPTPGRTRFATSRQTPGPKRRYSG